jgi:hypothetical protein
MDTDTIGAAADAGLDQVHVRINISLWLSREVFNLCGCVNLLVVLLIVDHVQHVQHVPILG